MSTTTSQSTERVYVLLREASELLNSTSEPTVDPLLQFFISSVELQSLELVERHTDIGDSEYPDTVVECVREARDLTLLWDLDELPPEAPQFILDLADLHRELPGRV